MVTLEVGIDAAGVVSGVQSAFLALDRMANSARIATNALEQIGRTGGAITALGATIGRLHPYLLAATTLMSGLSLAMQLFETKSDAATQSVKEQTTALDALIKKRAELDIRSGYGASDPRLGTGGTIDALTALRMNPGRQIAPSEAAGLFGVSENELRWALARTGFGESALIQNQAPTPPGFSYGGVLRAPLVYERNDFSSYDYIKAGEDLLSRRRAAEGGGGVYGPPAPSAASLAEFDRGYGGRTDPAGLFPGIEKASREQAEEMARAMREMEQTAQNVGNILGDAAARFVTGMATARELAQALAFELLRAGLSAGFTELTRGVMSGMGFGATPTQKTG